MSHPDPATPPSPITSAVKRRPSRKQLLSPRSSISSDPKPAIVITLDPVDPPQNAQPHAVEDSAALHDEAEALFSPGSWRHDEQKRPASRQGHHHHHTPTASSSGRETDRLPPLNAPYVEDEYLYEFELPLGLSGDESRCGDDEDYEEFDPFLFIRTLPEELPDEAFHHGALLPPKPAQHRDKLTLVLDLDETLVHSSIEPLDNADVTFSVESGDHVFKIYGRRRPYLSEFLEAVHGHFEVVLFTASQAVYANKILDRLDPDGKYFHHRLFRDACVSVDGNFLKDLRVLGRPLSSTVIVDNSIHVFGFQMDNGIPIDSWFDDDDDVELLKLTKLLDSLRHAEDVRHVISKKFGLKGLVDSIPLPRVG